MTRIEGTFFTERGNSLTTEEKTVIQRRSRHKKLALLALLVGVMGCAGAQVISNPPTQEESRGNSDQAVVLRAEKLLAEAIAAMDNQDWLRANALLKEGLDAVGNRHVRPITSFPLLDDTGLALGAALYSEKQSRFDQAANLRKTVLSSRLGLLRDKLRAETVR
ncbi:MAG: hypothetical protein HEQ39_07630 [Rhizobacter sp.]